MDAGVLMSELRKCPWGKPFAVKVDGKVLSDGRLEETPDGVFLVFGKKPAKKKKK